MNGPLDSGPHRLTPPMIPGDRAPVMDKLIVGGSVEFKDASGSTRIDRLAPRVLRYTNTGRYTTEVGGFALQHTSLVLDEVGGELCCFYDWWAMTTYSTQARADATAFMLKHRAKYRAALFLTSSPMVSMGVNVANVVLGGFLKGTTSRDDFDRRFAKILGEQS
ncbi:MAG TPA: hypothetical protein VGF99_05545 [Myxococcota bacterium]